MSLKTYKVIFTKFKVQKPPFLSKSMDHSLMKFGDQAKETKNYEQNSKNLKLYECSVREP